MLKDLLQKFQKQQTVQLPGYAALGVIRQGGTAIVFKAREHETGRIVAVKVHKPAVRKPGERKEPGGRRLTEGEVVASLNHPNVVRCFSHGLLAGAHYLVLEYLEGATLDTVMAGGTGRLEGHRMRILRQAAAALAHVHARGFIHYDFCLKNLFITPGGLKLIDFALAVPLLDRPVTAPRPGTTEITAPEVLRREPSDQRADIFAWGVVAYEVLSGEWPFERADQHQTLNKILNVKPMPLDKRVPGVAPEVCGVIMRCLEKDPMRRVSAMSAVVAVLDQYRQDSV